MRHESRYACVYVQLGEASSRSDGVEWYRD